MPDEGLKIRPRHFSVTKTKHQTLMSSIWSFIKISFCEKMNHFYPVSHSAVGGRTDLEHGVGQESALRSFALRKMNRSTFSH